MKTYGNIEIIKGQTKSLFYCIIDRSGNVSWFNPDELIKQALKDKGLIILALDSYDMKDDNAQSFYDQFKKLNIDVELRAGNLWTTIAGTQQFIESEGLFSDGNEFIIATNPLQNAISSLLNPLKGWQKDKLKEKVIQTLELNLQNDDLYLCDDASDIIFISKNESVISLIAEMAYTCKKQNENS